MNSRVCDHGQPKLLRLLVLVLSSAITLGVGEWWVRVRFPEVEPERANDLGKRGMIGTLVRLSADEGLFYELRAGLRAEWRNTIVATSTDGGERVSTIPEVDRDNGFRIAVLGDSTSFGWGVYYESSYPTVFAQKLSDSLQAPVWLRNFSVPGYNTLQELACFRQRVAPWKPDLIILNYDHNDAEPCNSVDPGFLSPSAGDNILHSALMKLVVRRILVAANHRNPIFGTIEAADVLEVSPSYSCVYRGPHYEAHLAALKDLGRDCQALGIPIVSVILESHLTSEPQPHAVPYYRDVVAPLVSKMQTFGFEVLPLYGAYQEFMHLHGLGNLEALWIRTDDPHPCVAGHELIGDWLYKYVVSLPRLQTRFRTLASKLSSANEQQNRGALVAYRRGMYLADIGEYPEAVLLLEETVRAYPEDLGTRLNLGRAYLDSGASGACMDQVRAALVLSPDSVLARVMGSEALRAQGRFVEARELLAEAAQFVCDAPMRALVTHHMEQLLAASASAE